MWARKPLQKLRVRLGSCKKVQVGKDQEKAAVSPAVLNRFKPTSNFVLLIVPRRYFCGGSFCFVRWCLNFFLCCWRLMYVFIFLIKLR